jgi:hypothetical protein
MEKRLFSGSGNGGILIDVQKTCAGQLGEKIPMAGA